jgi:hypothetical protein
VRRWRRNGTLYRIGGNVKWWSSNRKWYYYFHKIKIKPPYNLAIPLLVMYSTELKARTQGAIIAISFAKAGI